MIKEIKFYVLIAIIICLSTFSIVIIGSITKKEEPPVIIDTTACIVIIDKNNYDVTNYRKKQDDPELFECGKDISDNFYEVYDEAKIIEMERYKVE